jgi:hypothetical protein
MKGFKLAAGAAALTGAVAVNAAPAVAAQFTASRVPTPLSEAEPGKTKGSGVGSSELGGQERNQEFKFGAFRIVCAAKASAKSIAEGAVSWSTSQIFATEVEFTKCLTKATFNGFVSGLSTSFNKGEPIKFVYHVNGFAALGAGLAPAEAEVGSGATMITIANKICKIDWPRQTVPAKAATAPGGEYFAAKFSTTEVPTLATQLKKFPSGFQKRLLIANEFKGMEWHYEEGKCLGEGGFEEGAEKEEGKSASYKGSLEEEIGGGNLGFE